MFQLYLVVILVGVTGIRDNFIAAGMCMCVSMCTCTRVCVCVRACMWMEGRACGRTRVRVDGHA